MKASIFYPSKLLKSVVRRYEFYDIGNDIPSDYEIQLLPGFCTGLLFYFYRGNPIFSKSEELPSIIKVPEITFIPPTKRPAYNLEFRNLEVIRVLLYPGMLAKLYKIPAKYFMSLMVEPSDALDDSLKYLYEQIKDSQTQEGKVKKIEAYLLNRLYFESLTPNIYEKLMDLLAQKSTSTSVKTIADYLGISTRHLNRLLKEQIGFSAIEFLRIYRFHKILKTLHSSSSQSMAQLGYQFGYYDQSHFIREFKLLSDQTPKAYLNNLGKKNLVMADTGKFSNYTGPNLDLSVYGKT